MTWGYIGGAAVSLIGGALLGGSSSKGSSGSGNSGNSVYDPYAPYRGAAAKKLNTLMNDPSTLTQLPEYQAYQQAAGRTMAAQGYTGSGNAIDAAAQAGGQAYQQAFNNLAMLSGAGSNPAYAESLADQQANYAQGQQNTMWGQIGSTFGNIINRNNQPGGQTTGGYDYAAFGNSGTVAFGYNPATAYGI